MLLTPLPSVTNCHTFSDPLPLEDDVPYGRPLNGFRFKIGLFSGYLSVVVDGQPKQRKLPETHFPESQTSRPTANRQSYMKPSLRVKITIIFSSIQRPLAL